jgi:serine/threonine-protein kinase RsbW
MSTTARTIPTQRAMGCRASVPTTRPAALPRAVKDAVTLLVAGEPVALLDLPATTGAIASGRRWAVDTAQAQGADEGVADVVELLASEVLTNAVRHGSPTGTVQMHVVRHGERLRVTVRDASTDVPVVRTPDVEETGGRGMQLVETLAADWGVQPHGVDGKSVWFEVILAS